MAAFNSTNLLDYAHTDAALTAGAPGGDALGGLAKELGSGFAAPLGNLAGNAANAYYNSALQNQQFENQMRLQDRAYYYNQNAVQDQARLQALGMQQAGLSPSGVAGTGAPSLQAGAAAGATSTMSNIFAGLSELVMALKAPTEIEKMVSETGLNEVQRARTQTEVDQYNDYNDFISKQGPEIFSKQKEALEQAVVREYTDDNGVKHTESLWDFLPEKTRSTYQKLIDGDIPFTVGRFKALMDDVEAQAKLAEADDRQVTAATHIGLIVEKLQDPEALDALLSEEKNQVKKLEQDIKESRSRSYLNYRQGKKAGAEATKISQETPTPQQSKELIAAQVKLMQTEVASKIQDMDQAALQDFAYLVEHGKWNEAALRLGMNATKELIDVVKAIFPWTVAPRLVRAGADALDKGKTPSPGQTTDDGRLYRPKPDKNGSFESYRGKGVEFNNTQELTPDEDRQIWNSNNSYRKRPDR